MVIILASHAGYPGFSAQEVYIYIIFTALFLKRIAATGKYTLFTHKNREKTESGGDIYSLITHIIIHNLRYYH